MVLNTFMFQSKRFIAGTNLIVWLGLVSLILALRILWMCVCVCVGSARLVSLLDMTSFWDR